ncbi:hypothetical protein GQ651_00690 [Alphaproteobacteria bacterium GH1-50]|uniref:Outer membrane scaffolding protein for murein synthesis (MipA/OmpV family) n=1 Tax=Kangsaoukella pontilimi TaxID=2691042 RepID=A0A7C9MBA5_9RHOB|nr:MipA/OmpV family protein [Kangsaoukella pontilimi]MXQ06352.1 hypothetical protein [Kangsaoukella pontilimi]
MGLMILFLLPAVSSLSPAHAGDAPTLPLWELGVGATARVAPDYPGASEYNPGGTVFPFVTYRGRLLEFGGDQTFRIVPFRLDRVEIGVTVDGSSAVDSRDNALRGALPDLDALAEIGPEVNIALSERSAILGNGTGRYELSLQTRGVFSLGDGIDHVGTLGRLALRYRQNGALKPGARVTAAIGPVFASEGVHDFFYATDSYDARGGYLGTEADVSVRYPLNDRLRVVGGVGVTLLSGAANRASPLFDEKVNVSAHIGLRWSLFQSQRRTTRDR